MLGKGKSVIKLSDGKVLIIIASPNSLVKLSSFLKTARKLCITIIILYNKLKREALIGL